MKIQVVINKHTIVKLTSFFSLLSLSLLVCLIVYFLVGLMFISLFDGSFVGLFVRASALLLLRKD